MTVDTGAAGRTTATVTLKRSKLGSGAAKVGASGKAKVRIRFTRKAARSLRGRKSVRARDRRPVQTGPRRGTRQTVRLADARTLVKGPPRRALFFFPTARIGQVLCSRLESFNKELR